MDGGLVWIDCCFWVNGEGRREKVWSRCFVIWIEGGGGGGEDNGVCLRAIVSFVERL